MVESALFNACAQIAREDGLTILKRHAEKAGLIISICSVCHAYLGEQDGRGITGISHGLCPTHEKEAREEAGLSQPATEGCS